MDLEKLEKDLLNLGARVGIPKKNEKKNKGYKIIKNKKQT